VLLTLQSDQPLIDSASELKAGLTGLLHVATSALSDFEVSDSPTFLRRLLASTWYVRFNLKVSLGMSNSTSAIDLASHINQRLGSARFSSALTAELGFTVNVQSV
jgi:hypothetical protein